MNKRELLKKIEALELICRQGDSGALAELINALESSNPTVRSTAAECLGQFRSRRALNPLIHKLGDHYREVRLRATESLGILLNGKKSPPALVQMLQDPDAIVRIEAVEALQSIGDKDVLPAMRKKLVDHSPLVRGYAAVGVAQLGGISETTRLRELLRKEKNVFTKACLLEALHSLGNPEALAQLLPLLSHKNYRIRCAVANILGGLKYIPSDQDLVLKHLKAQLREEPTNAARSSLRTSITALKS